MSEDVLTVASQLGYIEDEQSDFGAMLFSSNLELYGGELLSISGAAARVPLSRLE